MARTRVAYPLEFRQQMVELVRAGRTPEELSREFEPTAQTVHNWVKQADIDTGIRSDGLTSEERAELRRLRREVKHLRIEREILKKAAARPTLCVGALLGRATRSRSGVRVRESQPGQIQRSQDVWGVGCLPQRVLRLSILSGRLPAFTQF